MDLATSLGKLFSALSSLLTEWPAAEETLESHLCKWENHLRQLEACRRAPEEDTPILRQFPGLRLALAAKIHAKINDISASISESAAAQSKLLGDALEICLNLKGAECTLGVPSASSPSRPGLPQMLEWAAEAETLLRRQQLKLLHFSRARSSSEPGKGSELRAAFEKCRMSAEARDRLHYVVNLTTSAKSQ